MIEGDYTKCDDVNCIRRVDTETMPIVESIVNIINLIGANNDTCRSNQC